jgi:hypothetical protein
VSVVSLAAGAELEFFSVDGFTWEAGSTGGGGGGTTIIQATESDSDNIVAAGTTQATATVLTSLQSRVTSGTPGGVMALAPVVNTIPPGVYNDSSGNLTVYPSTGCSFYAQSAGGGAYTQLAQNAPVLLSPGASVNLVPFSSTVSRVSVS